MYEHVKENKVGKIFNFSFNIKAKKDPDPCLNKIRSGSVLKCSGSATLD